MTIFKIKAILRAVTRRVSTWSLRVRVQSHMIFYLGLEDYISTPNINLSLSDYYMMSL
jgi:hypothetical protein